MPFVPNMSRDALAERVAPAPAPPVAWPFVDELYDYTQLLGPGKTIASLPSGSLTMQVAIVGAGPAGMVAAYELLKLGLTPVVFEASNRIGGRNWSQYFLDGTAPSVVIAEMGAMRVPTQNKVFYYYADLFGLQFSDFPDPGKVPTLLYYENELYDWQPTDPAPPGPFAAIRNDFNDFVGPLLTKIWTPWAQQDWTTVQQIWQSYIDEYKDTSFYEALVEGIPKWSTEDLNAFGALGMGSGGFGPLYSVGFLELLRILVNQFESDQQLIQYGISGLTDCLHTESVTWPNGQQVSLESLGCVFAGTRIEKIQYEQLTGQVTLQWSEPTPGNQTFDAVILATTTRSMELIGLTTPLPQDSVNSVVTEPVKTALRNLHLMESSKLFIRTKTKFWLDGNGDPIPGMPQAIQTDELPRQVYCLDYPQTDNGVVLISYTWGDDSAKLLALTPAQRFRKFKEILTVIHPGFAAQLVPMGGDDQILNVDWEAEADYYGAFKLQYPGQDSYAQAAFFQFQSVLDASDRGVYLAGDSVSWAGGWTEGALHTALNAACAVAHRFGGTLPASSPLTIDPGLYTYSD